MSANRYIFNARYLQGWKRHYFWHYFQCSSYNFYSRKQFSFTLCGIITHLRRCLSSSINLQMAIQWAASLWTVYQGHAANPLLPITSSCQTLTRQLGRDLALHGGEYPHSWLALSPQSSFSALGNEREQLGLGNTQQTNLLNPVIQFTKQHLVPHLCFAGE